jgi:hypothetical protein
MHCGVQRFKGCILDQTALRLIAVWPCLPLPPSLPFLVLDLGCKIDGHNLEAVLRRQLKWPSSGSGSRRLIVRRS